MVMRFVERFLLDVYKRQVDNPPYQSFEDVMLGYTIPRDFYSGAGASYCGYPFGELYPIGGLP